MATQVDFAGAEQLLQEAEFLDCRPVWYSSNSVYLAQLSAGGEQFAAIYKPHKGESPLWDFPDGHLYKHEAAAYELAKLLGWDFVPPTVVRDGPQGVGSLQLFMPHDPEEHFFVQREREELLPQLMRMDITEAVHTLLGQFSNFLRKDDERYLKCARQAIRWWKTGAP